MTTFTKYQHVERLDKDNTEVDGLLTGEVILSYKIDGTNASMGIEDGKRWYAKRTQVLGEGDDNRQFKALSSKDERYDKFFAEHPDMVLNGEWLVPHTIKSYHSDAWYRFYVFDVTFTDKEGIVQYVHPYTYIPWLMECGIDYVPVMARLENPTIEDIENMLPENHFLLDDDVDGEGIVVKNYGNYKNPYGRQTWGKIVRTGFKVQARTKHDEKTGLERKIVENLLTKEYVLKEYEKVLEEDGDTPYIIPKVLGIVCHEFVKDYIGEIIKKYKRPVIDFRELYKEIEIRVKQYLGW